MVARTYSNPVYDGYFADPYVFRAGSEFYAIGTGPSEAEGKVTSAGEATVFPLLRSPDLVDWRPAGRALVRPADALGSAFWAPEIVYADGTWYLYYSVGHGDERHQLRVASSDRPLGPYLDCAALTSLESCAFAIDPHPFRDDDGRWYLFHARDFLSTVDDDGASVRPGTALVVHPLVSMTELSPTGRTVARARYDWQRFRADRPMYGGTYDWHTLEGPFLTRHAGRYYCLYSGGCWQNESYGVDYVSADSVMGPYVDRGAEHGPRVLRTVPGSVLGPGHCSVVRGPREQAHYVVYHAWGADMEARRMCIDKLSFTAQGPRSEGPTRDARTIPG